MVSKMTLDDIARHLNVETLEAKHALNRIGICAPAGGKDAILMTPLDLKRTAANLEQHRRGWTHQPASPRERLS